MIEAFVTIGLVVLVGYGVYYVLSSIGPSDTWNCPHCGYISHNEQEAIGHVEYEKKKHGAVKAE